MAKKDKKKKKNEEAENPEAQEEELEEQDEAEEVEVDDIDTSAEGGDSDGEGGEDGEDGEPKKKSKTKLLLIILLLVVLGGGGAGLYLTGIIGGGGEKAGEGDELTKPSIQYLDLEEFLVNLNNPGRQVSFLKISVTLELPNLKARNEAESQLPRIRDSFQIYLRELRSNDLRGSAGIHRLREELLLRINKIIAPLEVSDILFKEIVVQ